MGREKSGGIVLLLSVVLAMVLANTNFTATYFHFFEQEVGIIVNGQTYLNYSLHHWINDGLMAVFFFVVGLELKREFIGGELADVRNTILPIGAAIGGMLFDLYSPQYRHTSHHGLGYSDGNRHSLRLRSGVSFRQ